MFNQFKFLMEDLKRWKLSGPKDLFYFVFEPGIWAVILYRLARFLYLIKIPVIKIALRLISFFLFKIMEGLLGAAINPTADIGPGLYVGHTGLIRVAPDAVVGKNLNIGPGVFIARKGMGIQGAPKIGDNVYIGVGAKVLGPITIGSNVKIGANTVVVKDVPDNATVIGNPSTIIVK